MSDDLAACAGIVEKGDPARFRAVMAAPPKSRAALFPLYAFNVEVARAPWVTAEPGIAEIRLQWWIDALEEIAAGGTVRRHEVVVPLALQLSADQARALVPLVEARSRDIYCDPFADQEALMRYLDVTSGRLLEVAAALLGQDRPEAARNAGRAQGVANWLIAVPALKAAARQPLPEDSDAAIAYLAQAGIEALSRARSDAIVASARPAFLSLAGTQRVLDLARRRPSRVLTGNLAPSPFRAHLELMKAALLNRW
jgi:phytoene/squalene synthetase